MPWMKGELVSARWHGDGKFYPATIMAVFPPRTAEIAWKGGDWATEQLNFDDLKKPERGRPRIRIVSDDPKEAAFRRLSSQRKEKALKLVKLMENFRNLRAYSYTAEEVDELCDELALAAEKLRRRLLDALDD